MDPKDNSPRTEPVELTDEEMELAAGGARGPAPVDPPDPDLIGLLADPPDPDRAGDPPTEGIIVHT